MTKKDSIFGAEPDRLRQLIRSGMDVDEAEVEDPAPASGCVARVMERPGTQIGCYKLLRVLGEGGMGVVYLAEQEQLIRRRVALKIIKPGMDSKRVLARFDAERQALALLDHPNIAQVHDAGTADSGRPYFVMEYVKGMPITEFCDRHSLTIEQRLRLFQQVCGALQHAHQKGIIHRDIKPSNILVTSESDQANPKIIDFGVAKAMIQPLTERTLVTEESQLLGTPEYMSPEQVELANEDIDTRSDIYSLGVLLYELLTGVLPFDSDTLRTGGVEHIRKVIRETDPKTPSTRLERLGEEAMAIAENRRMELQVLAKHLRKELEWIPLKAMRKERSERYRSASELSDDIENYLKGDPLMAGPLTAGYRLRKFLRRHKALVGGVAAVLLVSVIGAVVAVHFALGQANALADQTRALDQNKAMAAFLTKDILEPFAAESVRPTSIREVFDAAGEELIIRFADYPLLEASMRHHFGGIYRRQFGDDRAAISHMERAFELEQEYAKETRAGTMNWLAVSYQKAGRYHDAEAMFRAMVERTDEAIEQGRRGPSLFSCAVKGNLAGTYRRLGRYEEAERYAREALDEAPWPKESSPEMMYRGGLAYVLTDQGRYGEAAQLWNDILQMGRSLQDKDFPDMLPYEVRNTISCTLGAMHQLGVVHTLQGNLTKAESSLEAALEEAKEMRGSEHSSTIRIKISLAALRIRQDKDKDAESLLDECLKNMQERMDDDHPELLRVKKQLGVLCREQDRLEEAEKLLNEVHRRQAESKEIGPDHPHTLETMHELAVLHVKQDRHRQAEDLLVKAAEGRLDKLGDKHPNTRESLSLLIDLYKTLDQPKEADKWRAKLTADGTTNGRYQNASAR